MADEKVSELTELAVAPASDDELYIRDVSEAAAAESKRITVANLQDHTPKAHSIASHNDTTATGAELETLTDGSETALHSHASAGAVIANGSYSGNSSVNRAIPHGLGVTPKLVELMQSGGAQWGREVSGWNYISYSLPAESSGGRLAVTALNSTNFYVGNATSYGNSANLNGNTYYWVAFG